MFRPIAREGYPIQVSETGKSSASARDEQGITDRIGLRLVYDRTADALEVVQGTNNVVICTPITFSGGVSLSKTNQTLVERLAFVFVENSTTADGTLRAREHLSLNSSNQALTFR